MSQAPRQNRCLHPIRKTASVFRDERLDAHAPRPGRAEMRRNHPGLGTLVRVAFSLARPAYRPAGWPDRYVVYAPLFLPQRLGGWSVRGCCAGSTGGPVSSDWAGAAPHTRVGLSVGIGACIS